MKKLLTLLTVVGLACGSVYAGCGKKVTNEGDFSSFDADTKAPVVEREDGKEAKLTATPKTKAKAKDNDKDGDEVKLTDLVGKKVKVISEHKKVDSVTESS